MKSTHTPAYRALIDALVHARKAAKLSQHELATRIGKPQSYVAKVESRERRLDVIEFMTITKVLGADPSAIIRHIETTYPATPQDKSP